jgi:hypothetical protein
VVSAVLQKHVHCGTSASLMVSKKTHFIHQKGRENLKLCNKVLIDEIFNFFHSRAIGSRQGSPSQETDLNKNGNGSGPAGGPGGPIDLGVDPGSLQVSINQPPNMDGNSFSGHVLLDHQQHHGQNFPDQTLQHPHFEAGLGHQMMQGGPHHHNGGPPHGGPSPAPMPSGPHHLGGPPHGHNGLDGFQDHLQVRRLLLK